MPKFQRAIHLRFHFAGTTTSSNDTYDPKMYVVGIHAKSVQNSICGDKPPVRRP